MRIGIKSSIFSWSIVRSFSLITTNGFKGTLEFRNVFLCFFTMLIHLQMKSEVRASDLIYTWQIKEVHVASNDGSQDDSLLIFDQEQDGNINYMQLGYIMGISLLGFFFLIMVLIITRKAAKKRDTFELKENKKSRTSHVLLNPFEKGGQDYSDEEQDIENKSIMPAETEQRILEDLLRLEMEEFYLRKDISLAILAALLQTNTKYLSFIINTHKGKDFNNYVNELRVQYVVNKCRTDTAYLAYKIAYIADEAGFSSHSKFTAVFKKIKGVSPSSFIADIRDKSQL